MKASVLDPDNEFNVERTLTKDDVKKLIGVSTILYAYLYSYLSACGPGLVDVCVTAAAAELSLPGHGQDAGPL